MTGKTSLTEQRGALFRRFFPILFPSSDTPNGGRSGSSPLDSALPDIEQLQSLRIQMHRLRGLRDAELDKAEHMVDELKHLEDKRFAALARARIEEDGTFTKEADQLLKAVEQTERARRDAAGVAEKLAHEADGLMPSIEELERSALISLGQFLDGRMKALVDNYQRLAPEIVESVLQIRALQIVMQRYQTGNSNGFHGEIHLPDIVAGDHRTREPLLRGDKPEFTRGADERANLLMSELQKLGHQYGAKYN
ncbi:MAG TPA: hypothetical protein PKZ35_13455 [Gammaproteobacteria bacterium]|nr:hypothetical protein [Gammaproteobacteria bacterium]